MAPSSKTSPRRAVDHDRRLPTRSDELRGATSAHVGAQRCAPEQMANSVLPDNRFIERELSWLAFNERVLELAEDHQTPLLERVRYLAIFASNLDEFYMVRVAGLQRRLATQLAVKTIAGYEPTEVLAAIRHSTSKLATRHAELLHTELVPRLREAGICLVQWCDLDASEQQEASAYFAAQVFPIMTPMAVDPAHPFPYISGRSLNLAVVLEDPASGDRHFARIKVPATLPRFYRIDRRANGAERRNIAFLAIENLIAQNLSELFPGMTPIAHYMFRVTRNADLEVEEDDAENLLNALEKELLQRRFGPAVRLEIENGTPARVVELLATELGVAAEDTYHLPLPLDLTGLNGIADIEASELHFPPFLPNAHTGITDKESSSAGDFFAAIRSHDILLHHPYDSFSTTVQEFIRQAAHDPQVMAIKQTLYRTSGDSPIVDALIDAAQQGKQVLALVEIKARFDEEANISWARTLERHGVHVVYGIVGLKTHAKLCLVVRAEQHGLQRYCHVGTGNYNPKTARLYEDAGLLTCDPTVVEDVARLFNQLSGYAPGTQYTSVLVAPTTLRAGLVARFREQAERARAGKPAWIRLKANSLVDDSIIDELYRASCAGAPIDVLVRGICALRPGVSGLSENIRVRSVLGRFLEHSRIYAFASDDEPQVWLSSADLMHRNLDRRVEAAVRITDPTHARRMLHILDLAASGAVAHWELDANGAWSRVTTCSDGALPDYHQLLIDRYTRVGRS